MISEESEISRAEAEASEPVQDAVDTSAAMAAAMAKLREQAKARDIDEDDLAPADVEPEPEQEAQAQPEAVEAAQAEPAKDERAEYFETKAAELEQRERALAERESKLGDDYDRRMRYAEAPAQTIRELVKQLSGIESDAELANELTDLVTELSTSVLGVQADDAHRTRLESKRAVRMVKAQQALTAKERESLAKERAAFAQQEKERAAVVSIADTLKSHTDRFPFLAADDAPGAVWATVKELHASGQQPDLERAAQIVNDKLKREYEAQQAKWSRLKLPQTTQQASVTQGAKAPAAGKTLSNRAVTAPSTAPKPTVDESKLSHEERVRLAYRKHVLDRLGDDAR